LSFTDSGSIRHVYHQPEKEENARGIKTATGEYLQTWYPDYVCDEIDKINSDYAVAAVFYGVMTPYESANPNMPKFYICGGSIDNKVPPKNYLEFYQTALDNGWAAELYIAYNVHHGFATNGVFSDVGYTSATQNIKLLENFLDIEFGYKNATFDSQWHYK